MPVGLFFHTINSMIEYHTRNFYCKIKLATDNCPEEICKKNYLDYAKDLVTTESHTETTRQ